MKYTTNLFESIKEALNKKSSGSDGSFKDFMKLEIGKTYLVRLIPNIQNPERTLFHYYHHLWNSVITNELVSVLCPTTYGERCPIDEYRSRIYKTQDKAEIERIKPIKRNENWLANVYVIKDPTNPDNQGQVKILRFGKQLDKIITSAISGDDAEDLGAKIFDLSENGCNLRIKVETNEGGYPTYVASKFTSSSPLEGNPDTDEIYESIKSLDTIFEHKSYDEVQKQFNIHFLGQTEESSTSVKTKSNSVTSNAVEDSDEDLEYTTPKKPIVQTKPDEEDNDIPMDDRIQDILKDL
jgi:hypothetical protein